MQAENDSSLNKSEDCLYLNIWVPVSMDQDELLYRNQSLLYANSLSNLQFIKNGFLFSKSNNTIRKTTMFLIHGGGFVKKLFSLFSLFTIKLFFFTKANGFFK